jgi:hypothetical protein
MRVINSKSGVQSKFTVINHGKAEPIYLFYFHKKTLQKDQNIQLYEYE